MASRFVTIAAINGYPWARPRMHARLRHPHRRGARAAGAPGNRRGVCCRGLRHQVLPWLVGEGWAKRMILTNERIDARQRCASASSRRWCRRAHRWKPRPPIAERVATSPRARWNTARPSSTTRATPCRCRAGLALERERFMTSSTTRPGRGSRRLPGEAQGGMDERLAGGEILAAVRGSVATLTLNRLEALNALSMACSARSANAWTRGSATTGCHRRAARRG
jgi:hypothetical protein